VKSDVISAGHKTESNGALVEHGHPLRHDSAAQGASTLATAVLGAGYIAADVLRVSISNIEHNLLASDHDRDCAQGCRVRHGRRPRFRPGLLFDRAANPVLPLSSTKKERLGIGLSLCRLLIETRGGRIWLAGRRHTFHPACRARPFPRVVLP
jgi:hypothetical protein